MNRRKPALWPARVGSSVLTRIPLLAVFAIGNAIAEPDIEIMNTFYDLGPHNQSSVATYGYLGTIFNRGTTDLHIVGLGQLDSLSFPFELDPLTCENATLKPSENCVFGIDFELAQVGGFSDSFDVASNDPDEGSLLVRVTGSVKPRVLEGALDGVEGIASLECTNLTTGQTLNTPLHKLDKWNCIEAGLWVNDSDDFSIVISGFAKRDQVETETIEIFRSPEHLPDAPSVVPEVSGLVVWPQSVPFGRRVMLDTYLSSYRGLTQAMVIINRSETPTQIIEVATTNALSEPFFMTNDTCSLRILQPDGFCFLGVGFRSVPGVHQDTFSITTTSPDTPTITVPVSGRRIVGFVSGQLKGVRSGYATTCLNLTTGQAIDAVRTYFGWDCQDLVTTEGDQIQISLSGEVDN